MNRNILVTGGAGYIGSHACKILAGAGYLPIVYDNFGTGHAWAVKWGPLERGDILDRARLSAVLAKYRPTAVIHFAALAYVGESVVDPARYYRTNVTGTLTLLDEMRLHGVDRIVFSSSCATYGIPDAVPISENAPQRPINPYGASKLMAERILLDYGTAYDLKTVILRYFNAAGADPDGEIGEDHEPETHLIPLVLDAVAGRSTHVTVFGTDYDTPDGTCIRDYVHVSDLADAHLKALQSLEHGDKSDVFNLGNSKGFTVRQVIDTAQRITGSEVPIRLGARRPGDPAALVSDATKAREKLGWQPNFTNLDEIIRTAWTWHQRGVAAQHKPNLTPANT